ncbi:MAG TPA: hypothetical protein VGK73_24395 [Polyangiaceae bacterium]
MARVACVGAMALGCGADDGHGGEQNAMCSTDVLADEKSNYAFSSTITFEPVTVAPMSNLEFDWSGLTRDFQGHELSGDTALDTAIVMFWNLPLEEFEAQLNADALFTSDLIVSPPLSLPLSAGMTSAHLYDFTINTTPVTPDMIDPYFDAELYSPSNASFLVGVQSGSSLGRNVRMLQAFNLDAGSSATAVPITDDSMKLSYTANLHDLTTTFVPAGTSDLTLDWSRMEVNGFGREFLLSQVTEAFVGHYSETPAELEAKFLDLDRIALAIYRTPIPSGTVLDFGALEDSSGASFPGIDGDGTWVVGLLCGNCRNPAPQYLAVLKPCST